MKRIALILVAASVSAMGLSVPSPAIDVKPVADSAKPAAAPTTKEPEKRSFQTAPVRRETRLLDKLRREVREAKRSTKQYDNYIDKDGDGVDDRLAKKAKVQEGTESQKSDTAAPAQKKKVKRAPAPSVPPNDHR